jgi:hypothetical protein
MKTESTHHITRAVSGFRPWLVGFLLFWVGAAACGYSLMMDVTVDSGTTRVVNLHLGQTQLSLLIVGCALMICGSIGMAAGYVARLTNALCLGGR